MTDKPILFSAPMIRALLEGRKTQTRRVLPVYEPKIGGGRVPKNVGYFKTSRSASSEAHYRPRFSIGDRLWVKEGYVTGYNLDDNEKAIGPEKIWYRATDSSLTWYDPDSETSLDNPPWRSPLFMPRALSRITLTVTDVRVQRLQVISEEDARDEGIYVIANGDREIRNFIGKPNLLADGISNYQERWDSGFLSAIAAYKSLWNMLNGKKHPWEINPRVAAYTFTVRLGNIDQVQP